MEGSMAIQTDVRVIEIREAEVPAVEPDRLPAEVVRTNVCGSDLHFWKGDFPYRGPIGHEAAIRAVDLGENRGTDARGEPIEAGDLLAPVYLIPCRQCHACQDGEFAACVNQGQNMAASPDEFPYFHAKFGIHYYVKPDQ